MIEIKKRLDSVGPGFCLAKYTDLSIHLETGHAHSCVHPRTHHIPVGEVLKDPGALHNSSHKISVRQQALDQQRPQECGYCWNMESTGNNVISDRVYFSSPFIKDLTNILELGPAGQHYPRRLEVSFSTTCNFKCAYCGPEVSSMWMKDLQQYGPIEVSNDRLLLEYIKENNKFPIPDKEYNPYIEAFWRWLPDAYEHIHSLRITGGEPLLNHNTFKVIEWVKTHPKNGFNFGINTNLGVPEKLITKLITELNFIAQSSTAQQVTVWTSGESAGAANAYARLGGDYTQWLNNIDRILSSSKNINVRIMTTYNLLSVTSYNKFLDDISELKARYPDRIILDTHTYLQFPRYLTIDILTEDFSQYIDSQVEKIKIMAKSNLSTSHEVFMAERLQNYFRSRMQNPRPDTQQLRRDFYIFINQFDQRNNQCFLDSFPEMTDFYKLCKATHG